MNHAGLTLAVAAALIADSALAAGGCANPPGGYQGFGRNTTGGAGMPVYRVSTLDDSGRGSLRDAVSQGSRCVVFDVAGTIWLSRDVVVKGKDVTVDGLSAPPPGITIMNGGLVVSGSRGARNVVARGIRFRGARADGITVIRAQDIVIDRVSVSGFADGAIDVTQGSRDVTIQWSILGDGVPAHNFTNLISYRASRVTSHHNLYINTTSRNPLCGFDRDATSPAEEIVCDVRNNLIWNFRQGTSVRQYTKANVVNNYYYSTRAYDIWHAIWNDGTASAYVSGNYSQNGWSINGGTRSTPFDADVPATTDAVTAAREVLARAGARGTRFGLDATDRDYIAQVSLAPVHAGIPGIAGQ